MKAVVEESSLLLLNSLGYVDRNFLTGAVKPRGEETG